jgi:superfamily II DNA or RNA helicase
MIPTHFRDESWCKNILMDLTRSSEDYNNPGVILTNKYYEEKDGHFLIPRHYEMFPYGHEVLDYSSDGEDINFKCDVEWRNDLQRSGFAMLTETDHGILKLPPGEGKTVVSIAAICSIGKKAIIFVHKDGLVKQWKDRFLEHSNITEDDIGLLNTDKCREVLKKPIVISTVQTMNSMITRIPDIQQLLIKANFGVSIWDECHTTTGAPTFSRTSMYMPCKRVFGLSATPGRADKNHDVIWKHLGAVYEPEGESKTMEPRIIMLNFSGGTKYSKRYIYWGIPDANGNFKLRYPRFDTSRYLAILHSSKNQTYIPMMQKIAKQVYNSNRVTLLISDRIKILDGIAKVLPKHDIGFYIPRSKDKKDAALFKKFVLSTPGSARDGTDRDDLDSLIMANSISNIDQAVGRVCRLRPNKPQPIVFDCVDIDYEDLVKRAEWRKTKYLEKGWSVEEKFLK